MNHANTHPSALELSDWLDGAADDSVDAHVRACPRCQALTESANGEVAPAKPESPAPEISTKLPAQLREAMSERRTPPFERGQVWRLLWDTNVLLGVIWIGGEQDATVMPLSVDAHLADDLTLRIPAERSPLGVAAGVWTAVERGAPSSAFDHCLGRLASQDVDSIRVLRDSRSEQRAPTSVDRGVRPGSPLDDRAQFRSALDAALNKIAWAAHWEPDASEDQPDLQTIIHRLDLDFHEVSEALGLPVDKTLGLIRGDRRPTADELKWLDQAAADAGLDHLPSEAVVDRFEADLLEALGAPEVKEQVVRFASERGLSERATRIEMAREAQQLVRAARRQRGSVDWAEVLGRLEP